MQNYILDDYEVNISKNANTRRMSLKIRDGKIYAVIPKNVPYALGKMFVQQNRAWIAKNLAKIPSWLPEHANYKQDKEEARKLIEHKLIEWNYYYNQQWGRVAIRDQSTRWGSASTSGNLNFSWRILYLPTELQDYIVVHEICHLKHHNHSKQFWDYVGMTIPEYKQRRKELKQYSL